MKRAAIYTRFSSEKQNERSCADQADLCAGWAAQHDLIVTTTYSDHAVSGASTINRLELGRLLRDARERRFDVVLCEALDRLSRDQADLARLKKDLAFLDIAIMTVADGEVGAMHIGLKGLMGELYLADLAQKTRRGVRARINAGASGGGRSYGYDLVPGAVGELQINEREAAVVRRIFAAYVAGETPRAIVAALNAEGVPSPRGGQWNASTINGSRQRANGIVQNRLYAGEQIWNRQRFIKDPATGKRVSRPNPETEWVRKSVPTLRIVDDAVFAEAAAIKAAKGGARPFESRRPVYLFSGLVRCAECGGSYVIMSGGRLGCSTRREKGTCNNSTTIKRGEIEQRALTAVGQFLADPEAVGAYVESYTQRRRELARSAASQSAERQRRLGEIVIAIERIVDHVVAGTAPDSMITRMQALEAERKSLEAAIVAADEAPIVLHAGLAERYRREVASLQQLMAEGATGAATTKQLSAIRALVERITVHPRNAKGPAGLTVHGTLAGLLLASKQHPLMVGNVGCGDPQQPLPTIRLSA